METFLFRPKPLEGECLSSYILRLSVANYINPYDIWKLLLPNNAHLPQSSLSLVLDICPDVIFDTNKFKSMIYLEEEAIKSLTFIPLFEKFQISREKVANSRITSGLLEKNRKYCPKCLRDQQKYKLIWQVKEIDFCHVHSTSLYSLCYNCKKDIPILSSGTELGYCPHCGYNLRNAPVNPYKISEKENRIISDWNYLLNQSSNSLKPFKELTLEQSLALRILHFSNYNTVNITRRTKYYLQVARNSRSTKTLLHLDSVLQTCRESEISLEKFFTCSITDGFINEILSKKDEFLQEYTCIAPWCNKYMAPNSLKRIAKTHKIIKNKETSNYYMYCRTCGTRYYVSPSSKKLNEMESFISFAWEKVLNRLESCESIAALSRDLRVSSDKVTRAIIFLAANGLLINHQLPLSIPMVFNSEISNSIKKLIREGVPVKMMPKVLALKNNDFFFYWFHPEIQVEYSSRYNYKRKINCTEDDKAKLTKAINFFLDNKTPISLNKISKYLNISPETLRLKGLSKQVTSYKSQRAKL